MTPSEVAAAVAEIYRWIDERVAAMSAGVEQPCRACGDCCDFERYGHKLFVTSPEMLYLEHALGKDNMLHMPGEVCPYMQQSRCAIHPHRFSGCRIFFCHDDIPDAKQGELSEQAIRHFKDLCDTSGLPYRYCDLKTALNRI